MPPFRSWVVPCLLVAAAAGCASKAPPDAGAPPQREQSPTAAPPAVTEDDLLRRRAAILRAEDRRVVDDALVGETDAPEAGMRARAARALGRIGNTRLLEEVLALAGDPEPPVRAEAAFALGLLEERRSVGTVRRLAGDADPSVRRNAAFALGFFGDEATRPELLALLDEEDPTVVRAAAAAVTRFSNPEFALDRLLELTGDERASIRLAAARALADLASRTRGPRFRSRKLARERLIGLAAGDDRELRVAAAAGLAVPATDAEIAALADLFENEDPRVRINVVRSVSFPGAPVDPFLGQAVLDPDERVALAALRGLGRLRGMAPTNVLAGFIVTDDRNWLRAEAVLALQEIEPDRLADMAKSAAQADEPELRRAAARLLWGREDPASIAVARALLADADAGVRLAAVRAMAGAPEPIDELFEPWITAADPASLRAVAAAAGLRLGLSGRSTDDRNRTVALLESLWRKAGPQSDPATLDVILEAAGAGGDHPGARAILASGMKHPDRFVALRAGRHGGKTGAAGPATDLPLEHYVEVLRWAERPRAALITVERPGFLPGRFTVRLDTDKTPLTAWNFAKLAEAGLYDGKPFHRLVPTEFLQTGDPDGDGLGGPGYVIRDEIHPHDFRAGTLAMASSAPDGSGSQWFVTLGASPALSRTHTAFGRVVQNFPGVVARVLPTDRVVSVVVYEGDGTEPPPAIEQAAVSGSPGLSREPS